MQLIAAIPMKNLSKEVPEKKKIANAIKPNKKNPT